MDRKVLNYNLSRLGFVPSQSNVYEFQSNSLLIKLITNGNKGNLSISVLYQSVSVVARVTRSLMGLRFTYKVERGLNGEEVSFRVHFEGYRGLLLIVEALQKLLKED